MRVLNFGGKITVSCKRCGKIICKEKKEDEYQAYTFNCGYSPDEVCRKCSKELVENNT